MKLLKKIRVDKYLTEVDVIDNGWISATDAPLFSIESATDQCIFQPGRQCMTCQRLSRHKKGTLGHWQEDFSKEETFQTRLEDSIEYW